LNIQLSSPVRSAASPNQSKCRPILESFFISAPDAAQCFVPGPGFAASIAHMPISIVRPCRGKNQGMVKCEIEPSTDKAIDKIVSPAGTMYALPKGG
jgi:hypothetical protein